MLRTVEKQTNTLRIATFNCEWRRSQSPDAALIRERVLANDMDVICLTETHQDFMQDCGGHSIASAPISERAGTLSKRKALLWSKNPWTDVDTSGPEGIPEARFVSGITESPFGMVQILGVVIPYGFAGVQYGENKLRPWEMHMRYIEALSASLPARPRRTILLGDFNQRVPRKYQPSRVYERLEEAFSHRFDFATAGILQPLGRQTIDHICVSKDLSVGQAKTISNERPGGGLISDHFGVWASVRNGR
jgi:endonuclease/exonuclease/phosphatase family metal-dependent hydrolase